MRIRYKQHPMRLVCNANAVSYQKPVFDVTLADLNHVDENLPVLVDRSLKIIDGFERFQKRLLMKKNTVFAMHENKHGHKDRYWRLIGELDTADGEEKDTKEVEEKAVEPVEVEEKVEDKPKKRGRKPKIKVDTEISE